VDEIIRKKIITFFFTKINEISSKAQKAQVKYIVSIQEEHLNRKREQVKKIMKIKQIKI
jgi:hypothetical protein